METLKNQLKKETAKRIKDFKSSVKEITTISEILNKWQFSDLCTPAKIKALKTDKMILRDAKKYLIERKNEILQKSLNEKIQKIDAVKNSDDITRVNIQLDWIKSNTWGLNPRPEINVITEKQHFYFTAPSVTGCGYCKESTAVANVLNQSYNILKILYTAKNKGVKFEYGVYNDGLPYFSGGVGTDCFRRVFNQLGYDMRKTASNKTFDAWEVTKMDRKRKIEFTKKGY